MGEAPSALVPIHCPDCARSDEQAVVLLVVDGPGVRAMQLVRGDAEPGDVCGRCPKCGKLWCTRVLRSAA